MPSTPIPNQLCSQFRFKSKNSGHLKRRPCVVQSLIDLFSQGQLKEAISSIGRLAGKGLRLDSKTLAFFLRQCAKTKSLKEGRWIHLHLKLTGMKHPCTLVSNHLINMYSSCGEHIDARKVFDKMAVRNLYTWNNMLSGYAKLGMLKPARRLFDKIPEKDVVSWNTMIIGYAQSGNFDEALRFYREFRRGSIGFNAFTFAGALIVSVKSKDVGLTRQVHCQVLIAGFLSNVVLSSSILDAYVKSGEMGDARRIFDDMPVRDVFSWTTLVSGYARWGDMKLARALFDMMPEKNPVSWTALVSGYARNGLGHASLGLFREMILLSIRPDQFTYSSCLSACADITSLKYGKQIHSYLIRTAFKPNTIVVSSLIDMYSKCGSLKLSKQVFELLGNKQDVLLWNPMLSALAQHGLGEEAMRLFDELIMSGVKPNRVTFVVLLNACSHSGLVDQGLTLFNSMAMDYDISPDEEHFACLIDLLGRAGRFDEVIDQLESMPCKTDSRIWDALIGICSIQGNMEVGKMAAERIIELKPQSTAPYLLLSSVYAASGNWDSVEKVRSLMEQRSVWKEQAGCWLDTRDRFYSFST